MWLDHIADGITNQLTISRPVELLKKMDIPGCAGVFNYFAGSAYHVLGGSSFNSANFLNVTVRQPYGVVGMITPWNVSGVEGSAMPLLILQRCL